MTRERLLAALRLPLRTWLTLAVYGALGGAIYWAATTGHLFSPYAWPRVQWVVLVVNVLGFVGLYLLTSSWFRSQDELREELDQARGQIDDLRLAVYEHDHDVEFVPDGGVPVATILPIVDRIATAELPEVRPVDQTQAIPIVRQAPVGEREPATIERELGGRTFNFRAG